MVKSTTGTRHRYWISLSGYAQATRVNHDIRLLVLAVFDVSVWLSLPKWLKLIRARLAVGPEIPREKIPGRE